MVLNSSTNLKATKISLCFVDFCFLNGFLIAMDFYMSRPDIKNGKIQIFIFIVFCEKNSKK